MTSVERVDELTDASTGVWDVLTETSRWILDLDAGTAQRLPGPIAPTLAGDEERRRLRTIEACKVGEQGRWTFKSHDYLVDYYFSVTSPIWLIQRHTQA